MWKLGWVNVATILIVNTCWGCEIKGYLGAVGSCTGVVEGGEGVTFCCFANFWAVRGPVGTWNLRERIDCFHQKHELNLDLKLGGLEAVQHFCDDRSPGYPRE
jgi:hypothetical protein